MNATWYLYMQLGVKDQFQVCNAAEGAHGMTSNKVAMMQLHQSWNFSPIIAGLFFSHNLPYVYFAHFLDLAWRSVVSNGVCDLGVDDFSATNIYLTTMSNRIRDIRLLSDIGTAVRVRFEGPGWSS